MDVRSLCGACENVCEMYMQIDCTCFCVGLEREGSTLLPWRGVVWFFLWTFVQVFAMKPLSATRFLDYVSAVVGGQNFWGSSVGADFVCPMVG